MAVVVGRPFLHAGIALGAHQQAHRPAGICGQGFTKSQPQPGPGGSPSCCLLFPVVGVGEMFLPLAAHDGKGLIDRRVAVGDKWLFRDLPFVPQRVKPDALRRGLRHLAKPRASHIRLAGEHPDIRIRWQLCTHTKVSNMVSRHRQSESGSG